jgi:hypothetical protein
MKKLLLLHNRHTADDSDIWRVAIRNGWETTRTNALQIKQHMEGYDFIRYYGNTLHGALIKDKLPFKFLEINPNHLANLEFYTKRKIRLMSYKDFAGFSVDKFIKPVREKWFEAKVYKAGEKIEGSSLEGDEIYVSNVVNFIHEVRCFVLNGEVLTSSLYRINKIAYDLTELPPEEINFDKKIEYTPIKQYVKQICNKVNLPNGVVIDFGMLPNGEWALIEFNEAWASGLYYCDPLKCLDAIVESQVDKIYTHFYPKINCLITNDIEFLLKK